MQRRYQPGQGMPCSCELGSTCLMVLLADWMCTLLTIAAPGCSSLLPSTMPLPSTAPYLYSAHPKLQRGPPPHLLPGGTLLQVECMTDSSDSQGFGVGILGAFDFNHYDVAIRPRYSPSYVCIYCSEKPPPALPTMILGRLGSALSW
jgi:hypothetical protein